ncbi:MAG: hypothetical protein ABIK39_04905 [candidate division WOR-3 bacterium]
MDSWTKKVCPVSGMLVVLAFFVTGCQNQPPSVPIVSGPQRGRPNDTLTFSAISVDKEGDSVAYWFKWNNETSVEWSKWLPSGVEYFRPVTFADTGSYFLLVKAKDKKGESGWSDTNLVRIGYYPPLAPLRPSGPDTIFIGDTVAFVSSALHPLNKLVSLQFDWEDTLSEWSGFVPPGTLVVKRHAYFVSRIYQVRCRARDEAGFVSEWSLPETVWVISSKFNAKK